MPITINKTSNTPPKTLLSPGHNACAGCGQMIAARLVADALGPKTIIANATGCLEVTTTAYPESSWGMPWIHSLFENASAVASGIRAALDYKSKNILPPDTRPTERSFGREGGQRGVMTLNHKTLPNPPLSGRESTPSNSPLSGGGTKVVAQGGDGGTFDIGFGLISGMWERGENILYVCYDNEGYMNTGAQASAATPWAANTTTTPAGASLEITGIGSHFMKKDMLAVALAHGLKYVAQTTVAYPLDIIKKVKKAAATPGPSYLQILVPCIPGWKTEPSQTIELAKLAALTGIYPVVEYINGQLAEVMKRPAQHPRVEEYLKPQGRFKHLFSTQGGSASGRKDERGKEQIAYIQKLAEENARKYNL